MILQAAADLDLDLAGSAMIGNSLSDMEAAAAAGVGLRICGVRAMALRPPDLRISSSPT